MIRIAENSSNIASFGYKKGKLVVSFRNGSVYVYFNVPSFRFAAMCHAKSKGRSFNRNIRSKGYDFTKVF